MDYSNFSKNTLIELHMNTSHRPEKGKINDVLFDKFQTKYCHECKEYLPVTDFGPNASQKDGLQSECIKCKKVVVKRSKSKKSIISDDELVKALRVIKGRVGEDIWCSV